jgi:flagellar FliL protein
MAEENFDGEDIDQQAAGAVKKKAGAKQMIIIASVVLMLIGAGVFAYGMIFKKSKAGGEGKDAAATQETEVKEAGGHEAGKPSDTFMVPLEPFVVNLTDEGRFMKLTVQLEVKGRLNEPKIKEKMPVIRDGIIILLSGKSIESITGSEGKLQLKDEMVIRANQALGQEIVKNIYFTEFVVQ